jgi:hypothetical protein
MIIKIELQNEASLKFERESSLLGGQNKITEFEYSKSRK